MSQTRGPGRPRGADAADLLEIARQVFVAHGFAGTTMGAIANQARVSKASLYRDYPSKDALYAAVVEDWVTRGHDVMRPHVEALVAGHDTVADLHRLARTIQAAVLSPAVLAMRTLVAAEAGRFPDVASTYVTDSWQSNIESLAAAFAVLSEQGRIRTGDPLVAAEQLTWLLVAVPLNRATLRGPGSWLPPAELDRIADEALSTFLARFGPDGPATAPEPAV